jgi:urease accessory protein
MLAVVTLLKASDVGDAASSALPRYKAVMTHDERHLRRRSISLDDGRKVLVDFPRPVALRAGDVLVLEDGSRVEIAAADEPLYEIVGKDPTHLVELAWHIGNRHLAAAIEADRIFVLRDHVIKAMLEGLGATVKDAMMPFDPARGAYQGDHGRDHHDHAHGHSHGHERRHDEDRHLHERDAGRQWLHPT